MTTKVSDGNQKEIEEQCYQKKLHFNLTLKDKNN